MPPQTPQPIPTGALSPEQIQAARSSVGLGGAPNIPDSSNAGQSQWGQFDSLVKGGATTSVQSGNQGGIISDVNQIGENTGKDIASAITAPMEAEENGASPAIVAGKVGEAGLQTAGDVAGGIGSLLLEGVKAVTPQPVIDALSSAAKAVGGTAPVQAIAQKWNDFATKYPDAAKDLGAVFNIGALTVGGEGAKAAEPLATDVSGALSDTAKGLAEQASAETPEGVLSGDAAKTWDAVKPNLTPTEQAQAVTEGKIVKEGVLGTVKQVPKGSDLDMIKAATPFYDKDPITMVSKMQNGIADEATKLQSALNDTGAIFSKSQVEGVLNKIEPPTLVAADPTMERAFNLVKNKMIDLTPDGGKLGDLLQTRKDFDAFISKQFPNLYNSDTLTPMRVAIKDVRSSLNDMIESRLPDGNLPDGTSFRDSLLKQSSLYDAIDNVAAKAPKVGSNVVTRLEQAIKKHPVVTTAAAYEGIKHILEPASGL